MSGPTASLYAAGDSGAPGAEAPGLLAASVGEQLHAARLARKLSIGDVATALKLSLHQVEALEADDWARLPCKTIIRGFVRNYARLLNLDSDALMATLDTVPMPAGPELTMPPGTNVPVPHDGGVERRDYVRIFSGLIVLLIAVAAYFFFPQDLWQQAVSAVRTIAQMPEPVSSEPAPVTLEVNAPEAAPAATALPAPSEAAAPPAVPVVSEPPASRPNPAANRLSFSFARPAWVEVRDGSGAIIFSQLSPAASQREIEGQPPFALVIGNAGHVSLHYKGKPVDLSKRSRDDVARITLE